MILGLVLTLEWWYWYAILAAPYDIVTLIKPFLPLKNKSAILDPPYPLLSRIKSSGFLEATIYIYFAMGGT